MDPITIKVNGVGPVLIERSKRARRISISIKPKLRVRVVVPYGVHVDKAIEFIRMQTPWIEKHMTMMKRREAEMGVLEEELANIDRPKAMIQLTDRLNRIAREHGFSFGKVSIRNQRTRWGSCSRNNNISLNVKLVLLPKDLADYVILHELVHTRIRDHSNGFWKELDRYVGDSKAFATRLRNYSCSLP